MTPEQKLVIACTQNDLATVKKILSKNNFFLRILHKIINKKPVNANYKSMRLNNISPLAFSCALSDIEIVKELLKVPGIDVNISDLAGRTPLMYAIKNNRIEITEQLLKMSKIDINIQDNFGETPLIYAVYYNRFYITKMLIYKGSQYNKCGSENSTAFIMACYRNFIDIVIEFLKLPDINYNHNDNFGNTALDYAYQKNNFDIVTLIKKRFFNDIKDMLQLPYDIVIQIIKFL